MRNWLSFGTLFSGGGPRRRPSARVRAIRTVQALPGVQRGNSLTIDRDATWVRLRGGIELRYDAGFNSVTDILLATGSFEEAELGIMISALVEDSVVVDVGANVGLFTIAAATAASGVTVHAFEPVPDTCASLEANVTRNGVAGRVCVNRVALADHDGVGYMTRDYHASNYLTEAGSSEEKVRVPVRTLDSYVAERALGRLDFLKVDVEGRELSVLKGATATITRFHPHVLVEIFEKDSRFRDRVLEGRDDVVRFMHERGYSFRVIGDEGELVAAADYARYVSRLSYHNYLFTPEGGEIGTIPAGASNE
jgi:FkbM family methyltransferase